jgi:hypothetical protein
MKKVWFDHNDSTQTVENHIAGKHTPDSIRDDAKREYRERCREEGLSEQEISIELFKLEW